MRISKRLENKGFRDLKKYLYQIRVFLPHNHESRKRRISLIDLQGTMPPGLLAGSLANVANMPVQRSGGGGYLFKDLGFKLRNDWKFS